MGCSSSTPAAGTGKSGTGKKKQKKRSGGGKDDRSKRSPDPNALVGEVLPSPKQKPLKSAVRKTRRSASPGKRKPQDPIHDLYLGTSADGKASLPKSSPNAQHHVAFDVAPQDGLPAEVSRDSSTGQSGATACATTDSSDLSKANAAKGDFAKAGAADERVQSPKPPRRPAGGETSPSREQIPTQQSGARLNPLKGNPLLAPLDVPTSPRDSATSPKAGAQESPTPPPTGHRNSGGMKVIALPTSMSNLPPAQAEPSKKGSVKSSTAGRNHGNAIGGISTGIIVCGTQDLATLLVCRNQSNAKVNRINQWIDTSGNTDPCDPQDVVRQRRRESAAAALKLQRERTANASTASFQPSTTSSVSNNAAIANNTPLQSRSVPSTEAHGSRSAVVATTEDNLPSSAPHSSPEISSSNRAEASEYSAPGDFSQTIDTVATAGAVPHDSPSLVTAERLRFQQPAGRNAEEEREVNSTHGSSTETLGAAGAGDAQMLLTDSD